MLITQFDTDSFLESLNDKHHAWHGGAHHGFPSRKFLQGSIGSGTEFLEFHRNLMQDFKYWNNNNGNPISQ